jgi:hypothetical protein
MHARLGPGRCTLPRESHPRRRPPPAACRGLHTQRGKGVTIPQPDLAGPGPGSASVTPASVKGGFLVLAGPLPVPPLGVRREYPPPQLLHHDTRIHVPSPATVRAPSSQQKPPRRQARKKRDMSPRRWNTSPKQCCHRNIDGEFLSLTGLC